MKPSRLAPTPGSGGMSGQQITFAELTSLRFKTTPVPEQVEFFNEVLTANKIAWNMALYERQQARRPRSTLTQRDDVIAKTLASYPDVPKSNLEMTLRRLDDACKSSPLHSIHPYADRGRQFFAVPGGTDVQWEPSCPASWCPTWAGSPWCSPSTASTSPGLRPVPGSPRSR